MTVLLLLASLLQVDLADAELQRAPFHDATLMGFVTHPRLDEISGLAPSRRVPEIWFVHNDSGNTNELFALSADGELRARWTLAGIANRDWEDLAGFHWQGRDYLLLAEIGDNGAQWDTVAVHIFEEPELPESEQGPDLSVAWSIQFRYPNGAQDAESIAVDVESEQVLVLNKRRVPASLYALPLRPSEAGVITAELLTTVPHIPQPKLADIQADPQFGRFRSQPTAMDIAPDGASAAVLTYRHAYLFRRAPGQGWAEAFAGKPELITLPPLAQAEAIAFDLATGALVVTSERLPAPLIRLEPHSNLP